MSTRHYARLVQEWVALIDLEPKAYGAHSLRRTKVAILYKKTGSLRACQLLHRGRRRPCHVRAGRSLTLASAAAALAAGLAPQSRRREPPFRWKSASRRGAILTNAKLYTIQ